MTLKDGKLEKLPLKLANFTTTISNIHQKFEKSKLVFSIVQFVLYFFPSLRTSETNYLNEAFSFYSAIRARSYYSRISKEDPHGSSKYLMLPLAISTRNS